MKFYKQLFTIPVFLVALIPTTSGQVNGYWYASAHLDAGKVAGVIAQSMVESILDTEIELPESDPERNHKTAFGLDAGYQFNIQKHVNLNAGINYASTEITRRPNNGGALQDRYLFNQNYYAWSAEFSPNYSFGGNVGFFVGLGIRITKCFTEIYYSIPSNSYETVLPAALSNSFSTTSPFYAHVVPNVGTHCNLSDKSMISFSLEWQKMQAGNFTNNQYSRLGYPTNYQNTTNTVSFVIRFLF